MLKVVASLSWLMVVVCVLVIVSLLTGWAEPEPDPEPEVEVANTRECVRLMVGTPDVEGYGTVWIGYVGLCGEDLEWSNVKGPITPSTKPEPKPYNQNGGVLR